MTETKPEPVWIRQTYDFPLTRSPADSLSAVSDDVPCCIYDGSPLDVDKEAIKIPIKREKTGEIIYLGEACSHACALAFMDKNPLIYNERSVELLVELARTMYNIKTPLVRARSIFALSKYRGYLPIEQFRSYGPQHFSTLQFPPFREQPIRIEDTVPQGEIKTVKSREEFLQEIQHANQEMMQKKKRHNEKLYQNSLECLMSKRVKTAGEEESNALLLPDNDQKTLEPQPFAIPQAPPVNPFSLPRKEPTRPVKSTKRGKNKLN